MLQIPVKKEIAECFKGIVKATKSSQEEVFGVAFALLIEYSRNNAKKGNEKDGKENIKN